MQDKFMNLSCKCQDKSVEDIDDFMEFVYSRLYEIKGGEMRCYMLIYLKILREFMK